LTEPKYSAASTGPRIDSFLRATLQAGGFRINFDLADVETTETDFEIDAKAPGLEGGPQE
jgi:hypothetical protein